MFIQKINQMILFLIFVLLLASCSGNEAYSANLEDLNGTWVRSKEFFKSSRIREWQYSWGVGYSIVETTLEIELEKKEVLLPGTGLFYIQQIFKKSDSSILMNIKGPGEQGRWEMQLIFHFLDRDRFWIETADWQGEPVGRKRPRYRLSGPPR